LSLLAKPVVWSAVLLWLTLAAALWRPLVTRFGLPRWPALGALLSAATIGIVTLTPDGWYRLRDPRSCLHGEFGLAGAFAGPQELCNVLMFVPLGFFLVLATRRIGVAVLTVALSPVLIELIQALISQRVCTAVDWFDNALGGLLGVVAAVVAIGRLRPSPIAGWGGYRARQRCDRRRGS
jgi:hypothetical protein